MAEIRAPRLRRTMDAPLGVEIQQAGGARRLYEATGWPKSGSVMGVRKGDGECEALARGEGFEGEVADGAAVVAAG